ncbi:NAD-dependent epimerase/dehydratase family protein [Desulfosarcina ovata]|uniref:UDP-glucose 4-epimerase n=1 Tax=Desulfosarcina ovata subsp. ovata TaxID=2752305 RepID=A0A5K8A656_9BACT|nr:NAD-dependent epimerase/dehydratase family protein [Desulfosarcina ovata]BBO87660.1 UDP-glucose 4-epimerase [Desulfosarcina ovata subsp. ovata]
MVKNWLITGGCGFIGTSLIRQLVEGGHRIRVLDNLSIGSREDLASVCRFIEVSSSLPMPKFTQDKVELVVGDILDETLAVKVAVGSDVIVHLAANTGVGPSVENPRKDCMMNVIGTFNYLEAARQNKVERFVFASSGAPAGEVEPPIHEELAPHPVSPYGASKLAGEGYCSAYYKTYGTKTVTLRFGNVYGPGSGHKTSVVAKFIRQAMKEKPLEIYGDGNQTRDFIFIDDLVHAIRLAVKAENACGETFQIATNKETTVGEMVQILLPILEKHGIDNINIYHSGKRQGDVTRNFSDTSKADALLGWRCEYDLKQGLEKTVQWFLRQNI